MAALVAAATTAMLAAAVTSDRDGDSDDGEGQRCQEVDAVRSKIGWWGIRTRGAGTYVCRTRMCPYRVRVSPIFRFSSQLRSLSSILREGSRVSSPPSLLPFLALPVLVLRSARSADLLLPPLVSYYSR